MSKPDAARQPFVFENTLARIGFLPWARIRGGFVQVLAPEWLYDLSVYFCWPFNWVLAAVACRFPSRYAAQDWPLDPALAPRKAPSTERPLEELRELIRRRDDTRLPDEDLWALFDSLPGPTANDMLGNWRGKVVRTGSWLDVASVGLEEPLRALGVQWGKRFFSPYRGDPFILLFGDSLVMPIPIWGNVSMPEIALRGRLAAAMTYDHQPWKDHFRVLDDGKASGRRMMLGNWMSREKNGGWFTLEALPELDQQIQDLIARSPY